MAKGKTWDSQAVGRRKSSVARVYMAAGTGKVVVNNRDIKEYFTKGTDRYVVNQPLNLLKLADKYDVKINVTGGGTTGQAGAVRLGIARAILKIDAELRGELKSAGFLTRDPRKVERQKAGQKGARAKYQFSKR
ncbi:MULTISPECIES: 30S ribosomal protein S9 [Halobacteriovorax]|uniref:Small ribosomal subunit protein uS9 n=1 Tax=Halobacteriovorax vibrionivorans TaxID=2152716 RepID=A0ABY0IJR9_9BACT|nr:MULTISPECIES: 30S ribosomal protein S9 [Halobacteriovorax]AYF43184.1 30S ribosomal protein S9 [Halobacteriovorax sp. BALOs_7]RZF23201.1 30S ribosomal protein S9 [Halobacteriovorax vibrionivorans]TGD46354.1 30S ribosomal protein S9 [Halobacteriovorax sp. Y22]